MEITVCYFQIVLNNGTKKGKVIIVEWYVGFSVFFATVGTFAFLVGMLFDSKKPGVITNSEVFTYCLPGLWRSVVAGAGCNDHH